MNLLTDVDQNNAGVLIVTWTPLPSIRSGLESHYHYVVQIQKMTSAGWGDWQDVLTVDHVADRDIYRETTDVTLEMDVRYGVRLQAMREHLNQRELTEVSERYLITGSSGTPYVTLINSFLPNDILFLLLAGSTLCVITWVRAKLNTYHIFPDVFTLLKGLFSVLLVWNVNIFSYR